MSFEHIPPQDAGNTGPARIWMSEQFFRRIPIPRNAPRGTGVFGLCSGCNSRSIYVRPFAEFSRSVWDRMQRVPLGYDLVFPFRVAPLEVAKQMAIMALAANPPDVTQNAGGDSLRRHIANPSLRFKPEGLRFFIYSVLPGDYRLCQYEGHVMVSGIVHVFCFMEMAIPPVGVVVLQDNDGCEQFVRKVGLNEVTHWFLEEPKKTVTIWMNLARLRPIGATSLDYVGFTEGPMYPSRTGLGD